MKLIFTVEKIKMKSKIFKKKNVISTSTERILERSFYNFLDAKKMAAAARNKEFR